MDERLSRVIEEIRNGIKLKKCWKCGCQQNTIHNLEKNLPLLPTETQSILKPLLVEAKSTFEPIAYDCLGCKKCFPADATNELMQEYPFLDIAGVSCSSKEELAQERAGWPVLPGDYEVNRYQAPVAICSLNSRELIASIAGHRLSSISLVGSLHTENLGIERVIRNVVSNPHIRFLILCGEDTRQAIGHLPGQSLKSLIENGVGAEGRIIGARGKRPVLRNIDQDVVSRFRQQVALVDMMGCTEPDKILSEAEILAAKEQEPFGEPMAGISPPRIQAEPPGPLQLDPSGYFVIFPDNGKRKVIVEHYRNDGTLGHVIEGTDIADISSTIVKLGLISRLDHACYLGKELARAADCLLSGLPFVQDKAPDQPCASRKGGCC